MAKMFEDAFRSLGILEDDDPSHVAKTSLEVLIIPKAERPPKRDAEGQKVDASAKDYVEITISPYVKPEPSIEEFARRRSEEVVPA